MKKLILTTIVIAIITTMAFSQDDTQTDSVSVQTEKQVINHRHSLGVSLFMIFNFFPESADYGLLTYGYQLSPKDRVFVEFNTWKYAEPMGTYGNSKELYPGFVRTYGIGLGYQRFHWRGLNTAAEATSFLTQYYDEDDKKTQKGFQLYLQLIAGYRFEFYKKRIYVEPAYALKYWPVNTNLPDNFAKIVKGTPKYIFEPSLNFGFRF